MSYPPPSSSPSPPPPAWGPAVVPGSPPLRFGEALRLAWERKLTAQGRARRSEYWWTQLGVFLVVLAVYVVAGLVVLVGHLLGRGGLVAGAVVAALLVLALLVVLVPLTLTQTIRRLHDTDKSGWLYLLVLVPSVGGLIVFVFTLLDSTPHPNQYGPWPKAADQGRLPTGYDPGYTTGGAPGGQVGW